eukprot:c7612_g1_i1 orf=79-228(+)
MLLNNIASMENIDNLHHYAMLFFIPTNTLFAAQKYKFFKYIISVYISIV